MVDGIFDSWDGSGNTLGVGDFLVRVERDIEVDLEQDYGCQKHESIKLKCSDRILASKLTLIKTRLSLRSTSVIESLLERDIFAIDFFGAVSTLPDLLSDAYSF